MIEHLRDPAAIYAKSFALIRAEANLARLPTQAEQIAIRMIHACGMIDIVDDIIVSPNFVEAASSAMRSGKSILVDSAMVRHGIIARHLPPGCEIMCTLNEARTEEIAKRTNITRSAAAVDLWEPMLDGALAVIGNAPTALFRLLEKIDEGSARPAAIVGLPVGFVGAAESKAQLAENAHNIPFITLTGRRGGSAMAAAVVNALAGDSS